MIEATLANLRKSSDFFKQDEIIHILDGRKKEEIGFFVPSSFKDEFREFMTKIERKKREKLLKRVAKAQKNDPISEGSVDDGL